MTLHPRVDAITLPSFGRLAPIHIKRDDLIHPVVSGNKLYKLKEHIRRFKQDNHATLVTFGGAFSNHLHATAYYCCENQIPCHLIIRGEEPAASNPTLMDCRRWGAQLHFISRHEYRQKEAAPAVQILLKSLDKPYVVPEGGGGPLGALGAKTIMDQVQGFDHIVVAAGTGTTAAGIIAAVQTGRVHAMPVLKGASWMKQEIDALLRELPRLGQADWKVHTDFHFGGYGKVPEDLLRFIDVVQHEAGLALDGIYTAKAFYGLKQLIAMGEIAENESVLFIHTGGLQGNRGLG